MRAVWLVRWRELSGRMRFWSGIVGYDPQERSIRQAIYLVYVVIFFSIWGFAVLTLLANLGADLLTLVSSVDATLVSIVILVSVMLSDAIIQGYRAGKHSPYIFSETDAEIICQTPVDRGQVALAWYLGQIIPGSMVFIALGVILRFACLQLSEQAQVAWERLPYYIWEGIRAAWIILPLYLALKAYDYALGAIRLRRNDDIPWLRWVPIGIGGILVALISIAGPSLPILLWPILFPLRAGFGIDNWLAGFLLAVFLAVVGLTSLLLASSQLNLSRAAQESRFRWAIRQASWLGDASLKREIVNREKLGVIHRASRIPGMAGAWALIWKDWVISVRVGKLNRVLGWLAIFGLCLGVIIAPDTGARLWAFILVCLMIGQQCTKRIRADLRVWSLTRQLAIPVREILLAEIASAVLAVVFIAWLTIGISLLLGHQLPLTTFLLTPVLILSVVLTAAFDIFRKSRSSKLLAGQVAEPGAIGVILGIIMAGIPILITNWLIGLPGTAISRTLISMCGVVVSGGITYFMWKRATAAFANIR